jgi:hypothetical protein
MDSKSDSQLKTTTNIDDMNDVDDDLNYEYVNVPTDGGFGWIVLIACFVCDNRRVAIVHQLTFFF